MFNDDPVKCVKSHKHLELILDSKLDFHGHISSVFSNVNKLTAALRNIQTVLPRYSPLTIYQAFTKFHLDCSDAIFDKIMNPSVKNLPEVLMLRHLIRN